MSAHAATDMISAAARAVRAQRATDADPLGARVFDISSASSVFVNIVRPILAGAEFLIAARGLIPLADIRRRSSLDPRRTRSPSN